MAESTHDDPAIAPHVSPLPPDAPHKDRIGTAMWAMATGSVAAVTWFAVLTLVQTRLLAQSTVQSVSQIDPHSFDVNFMVYGLLLGIAFAAVVAWTLMFAVPSSYRRGGLSLVSAFAGAVLAGVLTYVARALSGPTALIVLTLVSAAVALWLARRTVQSVT